MGASGYTTAYSQNGILYDKNEQQILIHKTDESHKHTSKWKPEYRRVQIHVCMTPYTWGLRTGQNDHCS